MFHILGFLFIIIIAILLIGLSIIGTVIRNIFDWADAVLPPTPVPTKKEMVITSREGIPTMIIDNRLRKAQTEEGEIRPRHKKLFSKDEGEYVDFEEIKE